MVFEIDFDFRQLYDVDPVDVSAFERWHREFGDIVEVSRKRYQQLMQFAHLLRDKNDATRPHYCHSLRTCILVTAQGIRTLSNPRGLYYSATLHDIGKIQCDAEVLDRKGSFSPADFRHIQKHVMWGYRLIKEKFDYSAEIILWHHRFQGGNRHYPKVLPKSLHRYSPETIAEIPALGYQLALADTFDAMHRVNSATGGIALDSTAIKERIHGAYPQATLKIEGFYKSGIFT